MELYYEHAIDDMVLEQGSIATQIDYSDRFGGRNGRWYKVTEKVFRVATDRKMVSGSAMRFLTAHNPPSDLH